MLQVGQLFHCADAYVTVVTVSDLSLPPLPSTLSTPSFPAHAPGLGACSAGQQQQQRQEQQDHANASPCLACGHSAAAASTNQQQQGQQGQGAAGTAAASGLTSEISVGLPGRFRDRLADLRGRPPTVTPVVLPFELQPRTPEERLRYEVGGIAGEEGLSLLTLSWGGVAGARVMGVLCTVGGSASQGASHVLGVVTTSVASKKRSQWWGSNPRHY